MKEEGIVLYTACGAKRYEPGWPVHSMREVIRVPLKKQTTADWVTEKDVIDDKSAFLVREFEDTGRYEIEMGDFTDKKRRTFRIYREVVRD